MLPGVSVTGISVGVDVLGSVVRGRDVGGTVSVVDVGGDVVVCSAVQAASERSTNNISIRLILIFYRSNRSILRQQRRSHRQLHYSVHPCVPSQYSEDTVVETAMNRST